MPADVFAKRIGCTAPGIIGCAPSTTSRIGPWTARS